MTPVTSAGPPAARMSSRVALASGGIRRRRRFLRRASPRRRSNAQRNVAIVGIARHLERRAGRELHRHATCSDRAPLPAVHDLDAANAAAPDLTRTALSVVPTPSNAYVTASALCLYDPRVERRAAVREQRYAIAFLPHVERRELRLQHRRRGPSWRSARSSARSTSFERKIGLVPALIRREARPEA